jgi:hypothetical protein
VEKCASFSASTCSSVFICQSHLPYFTTKIASLTKPARTFQIRHVCYGALDSLSQMYCYRLYCHDTDLWGRASPAFMHAYAKHTSAATKMKDRMCTPRSIRCEPRSCLLGFLESSKSVVPSEILCSRILGSWQKNNIMR